MKKLLLLLAGAALSLALSAAPARAQVVTVNAGTNGSILSPFAHQQPNAVYEAIYKQTQLNRAGSITRLAFEKNSGTSQDPLTRTFIYLKPTTATTFTTGPIDSTGYQRVWSGSFPNTGTSGYQEVALTTPFAYDNVSNLALLVIRRSASALSSGTSLWNYAFVGSNVARRYTAGAALASTTQLTTTDVLVNLRLTFGTATATAPGAASLLADVYPNPATTECRVQLPTTQPATCQLRDLLGRALAPATRLLPAPDGTATIPLADLPAGTYLLHLTQGATQLTQRLTKQ